MITYVQGDLLASSAVALVNPVNAVGVMGAGLAKQFAQRYPGMLDGYRAACQLGQLTTGRVHLHQASDGHLILNVPTKKQWRDPSRIEYITDVMPAIVAALLANGVASIAIPPLGCGLGGLEWSQVEPIIVSASRRNTRPALRAGGRGDCSDMSGRPCPHAGGPGRALLGGVTLARLHPPGADAGSSVKGPSQVH